jgi:hypothetical protein
MNAEDWIQKFNTANSPHEILDLWTEMLDRLPDNEADDITLEVHRSVSGLVIKSVNEIYKDEKAE